MARRLSNRDVVLPVSVALLAILPFRAVLVPQDIRMITTVDLILLIQLMAMLLLPVYVLARVAWGLRWTR